MYDLVVEGDGTRGGNQSFLSIQSVHAKDAMIAHSLLKLSGSFKTFVLSAEQLDKPSEGMKCCVRVAITVLGIKEV